MSSWCRNSSLVPCLQDRHQENTSHQGCRCCSPLERTWRHMHFGNTKNFPYERRNGLAQMGLCCLLLPQKMRSHTRSIWLLPKWFSMTQISLQIKNWAKINIGVRLNMNLRGKMTWMICLATRQGNENSSMMLKKRCCLSIHNKVKSEQCFAVTSAKRVPVFQVSLKVVREEAGAQLSSKDNKHTTSQGSKCI